MIRFVLKIIQIFLAIIIFWIASAFGVALLYAFTASYPSCRVGEYVPCSLQLEYFFYSFLIFLIFSPFLWFQSHLYLENWAVILSQIFCGTISVICFFKTIEFVCRHLGPANASLNQKRQKHRKRNYLFLIIIATILLGGAIDLQSKLTSNSNSANNLPKELGDVQVLTSIIEPAFRESCDLYIFALKLGISNKIKEIGITYFENDAKRRNSKFLKDRNPYSQWKHTPVPEDSYAWNALSCGKTDRELIERIRSGMESAGGYYIMTRNKEGVIVVLPNENLAVKLYYG